MRVPLLGAEAVQAQRDAVSHVVRVAVLGKEKKLRSVLDVCEE